MSNDDLSIKPKKYNPNEAYRLWLAEKKPYDCTGCGSTVMRNNYAQRRRPWDGRCSSCKASERTKTTILKGGKPHNYNSSKYVTGTIIGHWRRSAKRHERVFALTHQEIDQLWEKQNGLCALTGVPLEMQGINLVSPDRIDNKGDYTVDNIRLVTATANLLRRTLTDDQLLEICKQVVTILERK